MVSVSSVSGVTVNAFDVYTSKAVCPLPRCSSMPRIFSFARASRLGCTSCASIERERSSAITSACSARKTGWSTRCHAGPAIASEAMIPARPMSHQRQSTPRPAVRDNTYGIRAGSMTSRQWPAPSWRLASITATTTMAGIASSHSGLRK